MDMKKGEHCAISGTGNITVELGWKGDADLDACAFLLGIDGGILNAADFVFYNSEQRSEPYDEARFGTKRRWMQKTSPVSLDRAVVGSLDDTGDEADAAGDAFEDISVNLSKVRPEIVEIVFCASIYREKFTFGQICDPYIAITDEDTGEDLCRYDLKEKFESETAIVAGSLVRNDEGKWEFEAIGKGFTGGLPTLIDLYA